MLLLLQAGSNTKLTRKIKQKKKKKSIFPVGWKPLISCSPPAHFSRKLSFLECLPYWA